MERVAALIHSLKYKYESGAQPGELLSLLDDLKKELVSSRPAVDHTSAPVAIWLPSGYNKTTQDVAIQQDTLEKLLEDVHQDTLPKIEDMAVAEMQEPLYPVKEEIFIEPKDDKPYVFTAPSANETLSAPRPPHQLIHNFEFNLRESEKNVSVAAFLNGHTNTTEKAISETPFLLTPEPEPVVPALVEAKKEEPLLLELELPGDIFTKASVENHAGKTFIPEGFLSSAPPSNVDTATRPRELHEILAARVVAQPQKQDPMSKILAESLGSSKIEDLKKGIAINDRFRFIKSLFRGDETLFERSVKTINNFNVHQEAQYWMQRELVIKLGWNEDDELVQQFYNLVNRRFL